MRVSLLALAVLAAGCASTPPDQDPVQIKLNELDTAKVEPMAQVLTDEQTADATCART